MKLSKYFFPSSLPTVIQISILLESRMLEPQISPTPFQTTKFSKNPRLPYSQVVFRGQGLLLAKLGLLG